MKMRCAAVASAATVILLLSACSNDDSSTTTSEAADDAATILAKGTDVELVGNDGLGGQTLNISAEEVDGEVTGEFRITRNVSRVECANTDTAGFVVLGGEARSGPDVAPGDLQALIIKEGDPDGVSLVANDEDAGSCTEMLDSISDDLLAEEGNFVLLEDGYDIETG